MASTWKRLISGEIDIDKALITLVSARGEINWPLFDLEVSRRFKKHFRELDLIPDVVPLFLWQQCYYLGSVQEMSLQDIQELQNITLCKVHIIQISSDSYQNWPSVQEYDIDTIDISKFGELLTEDNSLDDIVYIAEEYFKKLRTPKERLELLITLGLHHDVSDIHLEPTRKRLKIRFRIDGLLRDIPSIPINDGTSLVNALKVMGKMDIADRRRPKDGSIQASYSSRKDADIPVDLRISSYPSIHGEKAVIRLLPQKNKFKTLDDIGFTSSALTTYRTWIKEPHGIIIITGPTGSGKTSTLYASLKEVKSGTQNIVTIEDPVEYTMPGITQGQVNELAGMTFANGLRAILRQDPDIVMVGEIRDEETAETAVRAALTGHLVFTTVHTNDVVSVIPRLKGLGLEPDLISDSLLGIVAQRLVRKICKHCATTYEPSEDDLKFLSLTPEETSNFGWKIGKGCRKCFNSGFAGREAIVELLDLNQTVKNYIREDEVSRIYQYLNQIRFDSFRLSALEKVKSGVTTLEEVQRVLSSHAIAIDR